MKGLCYLYLKCNRKIKCFLNRKDEENPIRIKINLEFVIHNSLKWKIYINFIDLKLCCISNILLLFNLFLT